MKLDMLCENNNSLKIDKHPYQAKLLIPARYKRLVWDILIRAWHSKSCDGLLDGDIDLIGPIKPIPPITSENFWKLRNWVYEQRALVTNIVHIRTGFFPSCQVKMFHSDYFDSANIKNFVRSTNGQRLVLVPYPVARTLLSRKTDTGTMFNKSYIVILPNSASHADVVHLYRVIYNWNTIAALDNALAEFYERQM